MLKNSAAYKIYDVEKEAYNDEAVGSLTSEKTGEVLVDAKAAEAPVLGKVRNALSGLLNRVSNLATGEDVMEVAEGYSFTYRGRERGAEPKGRPDGKAGGRRERRSRQRRGIYC